MPSLFGESAVSGEMSANMIQDALLGRVVGIGHKVNRVFVFDLKSGPGIIQQQATRRLATIYGNRKKPRGRDSLIVRLHAHYLSIVRFPLIRGCLGTSLFLLTRR